MRDDVDGIGDPPARSGLPTLVRAGCIALVLLGVLSAALASPSLVSARSVRCSLAEQLIEDANDDDKDWNNVDTGGVDANDLQCDAAVVLAEGIPEKDPAKENSDKTLSVPEEGAIRLRGILAVVVGIGQTVTAVLLMRTRERRIRTITLVMASLGVVFPVLGIISVAALVFVAYGIGFSSAAQSIWPRLPRGGKATPE